MTDRVLWRVTRRLEGPVFKARLGDFTLTVASDATGSRWTVETQPNIIVKYGRMTEPFHEELAKNRALFHARQLHMEPTP